MKNISFLINNLRGAKSKRSSYLVESLTIKRESENLLRNCRTFNTFANGKTKIYTNIKT
jgi:hypothetical protein